MKKNLLLVLFSVLAIVVNAQVKVKSYTRKDGTVVREHMRSNPDGNPYNNWSYPGNTNPYTGEVATGNADTYLRNYYNSNSNESDDYSSSAYNTYFITASSLRVRSGPSAESSTITTLTLGEDVKVIRTINSKWKKVLFSYYDYKTSTFKTKEGYVSSQYLSIGSGYSSSNSLLNTDKAYLNLDNPSNNTPLEEKKYARNYEYMTSINAPSVNLYEKPNIDHREVLYSIPQNSKIYVIDNSGEIFSKIYVDGYIGYIIKLRLVRKQ